MSRTALVMLAGMALACSSSSQPASSPDAGVPDAKTQDTGVAEAGGSCPATTVVTGTIAEEPLSPTYAFALKGVEDPAYPNQVTIVISNTDGLCALLQSTGGLNKGDLEAISLVLGATSGTAAPVAPGSYTQMDTTNELTAEYESLSSTCDPADAPSSGGSVVVCGVGGSYTGTFDVTFGSDHVTGTFDAPLCDVTVLDGGDPGVTCTP